MGRPRLPLLAYLGIIFSFYFVLLGPTGLVGEPRYSLEWGITLFLIALAGLAGGSRRAEKSFALKLGFGIAVVSVSALVILANHSLFRDNLAANPNSSSQVLNSYRPLGYSKIQDFLLESQVPNCVPVGVIYGAGNEILANRTLGVVKFARESHRELRAAQIASSGHRSLLSGIVASSSRFECLYGSNGAFLEMNGSSWEGWEVSFRTLNSQTGLGAIVIQR